jgi:hypothetical protein
MEVSVPTTCGLRLSVVEDEDRGVLGGLGHGWAGQIEAWQAGRQTRRDQMCGVADGLAPDCDAACGWRIISE